MKKRVTAAILAFVMLLGGCASPYPDMTPEQEMAITRYAARQLIEHNKGYKSGIVDITGYEYVEPTVAPEVTPEPSVAPTQQTPSDKEDADLGLSGSQGTKEKETYSLAELTGFLEEEAFTISYVDYRFCKKYPETEDDFYLYAEANAGKKLFVVRFRIQNLTAEEQRFSNVERAPEFAVVADDDLKKAALFTYLENDLSLYEDTIEAGGSREVVLVMQVPEGQREEYSSMILRARYNGEIKQFTIY